MKNLIVGVHVAGTNVPRLIDGIAAAERAGIQCAWLTCGSVAPDPLVVFAAAALRTTRILLGTSIIPTFPRHPLALVQGALAVDALAPGRLRLGVGPSHKPSIEGTWGIPFERPQEMIDALVVHGTASQVKERLRQLPSFGADELLVMPILPPGDEQALPRTLATLGELAAE